MRVFLLLRDATGQDGIAGAGDVVVAEAQQNGRWAHKGSNLGAADLMIPILRVLDLVSGSGALPERCTADGIAAPQPPMLRI